MTAASSAALSTACPHITSHGNTYDSSPHALASPWSDANGYTQNHTNFPDKYEHWAGKAASGKAASGKAPQKQTHKATEASGIGPATRSAAAENIKQEKQEVAILVYMAVVMPEKSGISKIGICVPLNHGFRFIYSITYHRVALKDLMKSTHILEETTSISCATTCCRTSGSLGPEDTGSGLRTQLCEVSKFLPQLLGRTLHVQSKRVTPYGVTFSRYTDIHRTHSDAVLNFFFRRMAIPKSAHSRQIR